MSRSHRIYAAILSNLAFGIVVAVGCNQPTSTTHLPSNSAFNTTEKTANDKSAEEEHPHVPGAHGGIVISIGSNSYHAEAVVEKDGRFRLLTLGSDETRIQEVDVQAVRAFIKAADETDATPIEMNAVPQEGDANGKTSQFVGQLPESTIGKAISVTIPNLRIGSERFRLGFTSAVQQHDTGMPIAVTGVEEQKLYFTPGGKYTEVDIQTNGKLTAGTKFKGFMSKHDMNPKPGEKICPVTLTKANAKIEWQVDGKKYFFCCPPCVDEFVRMAKEEPDNLQAPEFYVQGANQSTIHANSTATNGFTAAEVPSSTAGPDPEIAEALAGLNAEDRPLAESQKYCAVATDSPLGSMGTPVKIQIKGETVFLCCDGCKAAALRDAEETLAKVAKLRAENGLQR